MAHFRLDEFDWKRCGAFVEWDCHESRRGTELDLV